jgi:hypothetical protein
MKEIVDGIEGKGIINTADPLESICMEESIIMKDRELIEDLKALEEIIGWLEEKERLDLKDAIENVHVDEDEISDWMSTTSVKKTGETVKH